MEDFEYGDEHREGKLNMSLYRTRDAAHYFGKLCGSILVMKTLMNKLCFVKDGTRVSFDFYMLGMESEDMDGRARAQERTSVMTNSPMLAERLSGYHSKDRLE